MPRRRAEEQEPDSQKGNLKICVTLDKLCLSIIELLGDHYSLGRMKTVRKAISEFRSGGISVDELERFRAGQWSLLLHPPHEKMEMVRFAWGRELDEDLLFLSRKVLRNENRSGILRILLYFVAWKVGVLSLVEVQAFKAVLKRKSSRSKKSGNSFRESDSGRRESK